MYTPLDPTAVLAALISGNQRHVDRLAAGRPVQSVGEQELQQPFVVVVEVDSPLVAPPELFDTTLGWIVLVAPRESTAEVAAEVAAAVEVAGCGLVVVLGRMKSRFGGTELEFLREERRCFDIVAALLGGGGATAAAVRAGKARLIGAIADDRDGRVHWLGEHPEQKSLVGARK
jgi:hypothetical protein